MNEVNNIHRQKKIRLHRGLVEDMTQDSCYKVTCIEHKYVGVIVNREGTDEQGMG